MMEEVSPLGKRLKSTPAPILDHVGHPLTEFLLYM